MNILIIVCVNIVSLSFSLYTPLICPLSLPLSLLLSLFLFISPSLSTPSLFLSFPVSIAFIPSFSSSYTPPPLSLFLPFNPFFLSDSLTLLFRCNNMFCSSTDHGLYCKLFCRKFSHPCPFSSPALFHQTSSTRSVSIS